MHLRDRLAQHLEDGRPDLAWDEAAAATGSTSYVVRANARHLLKTVARRMPEAAWSPRRRQEAARWGISTRAAPTTAGRVAFPVVHADGRGWFLVCVVHAAGGPEDMLPAGLDATTLGAIRDALAATRQAVPACRGPLQVSFEGPKDWDGPSCGLAVALAAWSAATRVPAPARLTASARVEPDGNLRPVGHIDDKIALLQAARPEAWLSVHPSDARHARTRAVATLHDAARTLGLDPLDVGERLHAMGDHARRTQDWRRARDLADSLIDDERLLAHERAPVLAVLLAAANHEADAGSQARWAEAIETLPLDDEETQEALCNLLVTRVDQLDLPSARTLAGTLRHPPQTTLLSVQIDGASALFHTLDGAFEKAVELRQANVARTTTHPRLSCERARTLGDLSDVLRRVGRHAEALEAAEESLAAVNNPVHRMTGRARIDTERFLRLHHMRAMAAVGRQDDALHTISKHELETWPPALRLLVQLEHAMWTGDRARAEALAAANPPRDGVRTILHHLTDSALARLGDTHAAARLSALPAFTGLDLDEIARRLPY